jgi:hypothetical protein
LTNSSTQLETIDSRHDPVQNEEFGRVFLLENVRGFDAVLGNHDSISPSLQPGLKNHAANGVVFGDKYTIVLAGDAI